MNQRWKTCLNNRNLIPQTHDYTSYVNNTNMLYDKLNNIMNMYYFTDFFFTNNNIIHSYNNNISYLTKWWFALPKTNDSNIWSDNLFLFGVRVFPASENRRSTAAEDGRVLSHVLTCHTLLHGYSNRFATCPYTTDAF